ncbi:MAG: TRAP transporter substrate-binding protein [Burkholderiaceae bacterium]
MKLGIIATFCLLLAGAASAQEVRIGLDSPPDAVRSGSYVFAKALAEQLKASGFTVKELPVNSIGGEAERLDQTTQGLLEVDLADLGRAAQLNKLTFGFNLAYLFDSLAHLDRADAAGGLLAKVNEGVTPKGAHIVALMAVGGGAGIFNTKHEIAKPDDMADLRMRALDENQMKLFRSWGTNGVVITMPEVANALQTGIADGYINPPFVPFLFGHGSILKFYTPANVSQSLRAALVSEDWYKKLPADRKAAFDAAVTKAKAANRAWVKTSDEQALEQIAKAGMKITPLTPEGRKQFQDRSRASWTAVLSEAEIKPFVDAANKTR